ncbi:hypothetical protein ACFWF3_27265, partial [Nocardia sp. NPDC060220]|uniref:hypothetical protein n=1 Tax=Nocardia sp. NPDC060220 TaxID=3347076 RepID=UPI003652E27E
LVCAILAAGCGADSTTAKPASSSEIAQPSPSIRYPSPDCLPRQDIDDPELSGVADRLATAEGLEVFSIRVAPDLEQPREYSMTVNLCVAGTNAIDDLRPAATAVAIWLKKNPVSVNVATITVTDLGRIDRSYTEQLFDDSFQEHLWDNSQSSVEKNSIWKIY